MGNGGCHEIGISIFVYFCTYRTHRQIEHREQCSFKGEGIVIPLFPPICKYNYNWPRDYGGLNMCECLI
jgi:hypothetical protein